MEVLSIIYVILTFVLYGLGIVLLIVGANDINDMRREDRAENWKIWRAALAVGLITLWLWPVAIILALPALIVWGLINALQLILASMRKDKETAHGK